MLNFVSIWAVVLYIVGSSLFYGILRGILASFVYAGSPNSLLLTAGEPQNWIIEKIGKVQLKNLIGKK